MNFFKEMLGEFIQQLTMRCQQIKDAAQAQDMDTLSHLAHNVKGLAANFNAEVVYACALEIETQSRAGSLKNGESLINGIESEIPRLSEFLQNINTDHG